MRAWRAALVGLAAWALGGCAKASQAPSPQPAPPEARPAAEATSGWATEPPEPPEPSPGSCPASAEARPDERELRAPGQLSLWFSNRMSGWFVLESLRVGLDGAEVYAGGPPAWEERPREPSRLRVYQGMPAAGAHTVEVRATLRSNSSPFGVFGLYIRQYRFKMRARYPLDMPQGKAALALLSGYERGGVTTPVEERPALRCQSWSEDAR